MELSNFEHLKNFTDVYEKCITDEKSLIEAYDVQNPNKTQLITIAGAMRGGLYGIVKHMVKHMNIKDDMVKMYKRANNMPSPDRVDNFGKLRLLESKGAFDRSVADKAHRIRKIGNDANHFMEGQQSMFDNMSAQETLKVVEEMYEKLYYFSHYFTDVFLKQNQPSQGKASGAYYNRPAAGSNANTGSRASSGSSNTAQQPSKAGTVLTAIVSGIILFACVMAVLSMM